MNSETVGVSEEQKEALVDDAQAFYNEIEKMRYMRMQSHVNVLNLQEKLSEERKAICDLKIEKAALEAEISNLGTQIENEVHQRTITRKHIEQLHQLSETVANYSVQNDKTLKLCDQNLSVVDSTTDKQRAQIDESIARHIQEYKGEEEKIKTIKDSILQEEHMYEEEIMQLDNTYLKITDNVNQIKIEIADFQKRVQIAQQNRDSILAKNEACRKESQLLEQNLCMGKAKLGELQQQIEAKRKQFQVAMEEMSTKQEEVNYRIQQKDESIKTYERAIDNQCDFNKSLQEKIFLEEKHYKELKDKKLQLENALEQIKTDYSEKENLLNNKIAAAVDEIAVAELKFETNKHQLEELEQNITAANNIIYDLDSQIKKYKVSISSLREEHDVLKVKEETFQNNKLALLDEVNQNTKELEEYNSKFALTKDSLDDLEKSLVDKINNIKDEIEQETNNGEKTAKAIVDEINELNKDFEIKTQQDQLKHNEQVKQLQDEIHKYKLEQAELLSAHVTLEGELETINKSCNLIKDEIDILNKKRLAQSSIPKPSPPPPIRPPPGSSKRRDFDELSGSSAEGNSVTQRKYLEYCRAKERRRMLKEQRKVKASISKNTNADFF